MFLCTVFGHLSELDGSDIEVVGAGSKFKAVFAVRPRLRSLR